MDWDDVRLFLAVARASRLAEAARVVGIDPTTIGRRIQKLERTLETTLFERAQNGHVLTERGHALLAKAERMEAAAIDLRDLVGRDRGQLTGAVRVSVSEGFGSQIVAPRLRTFLDLHPLVAVELVASTGFLNPSRRETDVAVMLARPKAGPLVTRKLTDYRLGLYASRDYIAREGGIEDIADLREHRLVGYVEDLIYAPELRYLAEFDPRLKVSISSSSIIAQAQLIASGAGCGILPCFIGDHMPGLRRLIAGQIDLSRSFWLVVHREARRIARIEQFIRWLDTLMIDQQNRMLGGATEGSGGTGGG